MPFRILRLLDRIAGKILLFAVIPLGALIAHALPARKKRGIKTIAILKLHGGGSLMLAMPALLGIRARYPQAILTLVGTPETRKYAELTGAFDHYAVIDSHTPVTFAVDSIKALAACFRHDVFIDLEPHSMLAAVFARLTFAARRFGFVKFDEPARARCYTNPLYFNLNAPVFAFYDQLAGVLGAGSTAIEACRDKLKSLRDGAMPLLQPEHPRPAVYISAFTSSLSPERMMPVALWIERLQKEFGKQPFTLILGGGKNDIAAADAFAAKAKAAMPRVTIISACGARNLRQAVDDIGASDAFWGIDSGLLHIARLLGRPCVSFWGPSNPAFRLRPVPGLEEKVFYRAFPCSPCVHLAAVSPCKGDNQCMKKLFSDDPPLPITRF